MNKISVFFKSLMMLFVWSGRFLKSRYRNIGIQRNNQSRPVAILGNGASLKDTINNGFSSEMDYCLVNFSPLSELFFIIKPKYYIMADGEFFKPHIKENINKVAQLSLLLKKVTWNLTIFVPFNHLEVARTKYQQNENITIAAFNNNELNDNFAFKKIEYKLFSMGLAAPVFMNVGVAAIYCLINCGYHKLYLYGMEHSWLKLIYVDKDNYVCMNDVHYYDKGEDNVTKKMYLGDRPEKLHEQLRFQATTFAAYWELKGYSDYLGDVEIINKTKGSFIDAFEKEY